ncbi:exodeoxyribonuclease III [Roseitranquillus sediminis]|uniref:exodeoxyribonuclease III n=1 Tax=Roseitranquillus sediminis TaxID=2809051 RepID=UPI001D0C9D7D|nr:exodeoxyribonuclease III [Roseitranquillus sediminis]MBM9594173.1 exodeoxyribonuclease III [Roseitranquillus sediminis]
MRIATFNINGINRRLGNLLEWLSETQPDVVCLQELKAEQAAFPRTEIEAAGYGALWRGQRGWNGVAILARGAAPVPTRLDLPGDAADAQRRYVEAAVRGVVVASLYAPNGNPQPGPKFDYKLRWLARLRDRASGLLAAGVPVVLAGDYNVVPEARDIYATTSYDNDALVQPEARAALRRLVDDGWTDALRAAHPTATLYTFWDYRRNRWPRDAGLRLDHVLLSPDLAPRLTAAGVDRSVRGRENASDHAPVWVDLDIR